MRLPRCPAACFLFLCLIGPLDAHDPGLSTVEGELGSATLVLDSGFAPADANLLLPPDVRVSAPWPRERFPSIEADLRTIGAELFEIQTGTKLIRSETVKVELSAGDAVSFRLEFLLSDGIGATVLRFTKFSELPPGHSQFVSITDETGSVVAQKILSEADPSLQISSAKPNADPRFVGFLQLGIQHIWTGYDHLLFLLALLIVCRTFRSSIGIISCFTVAHSVTLALATLNVVYLPARLVEPAIAASIVFVGLENLWRGREQVRGRWALTFVFGLLHGFGFASVLRDLGVGVAGRGLVMPLFSFNLGVEIGQIAIAAVVLPVIWHLRKKPKFVLHGIPILSGIVVVAGLYWLVERTVPA